MAYCSTFKSENLQPVVTNVLEVSAVSKVQGQENRVISLVCCRHTSRRALSHWTRPNNILDKSPEQQECYAHSSRQHYLGLLLVRFGFCRRSCTHVQDDILLIRYR